ncbi:MAG: hypothetical protein ACR2LQ_00160 [Acidimicrobiales bacterium]
MRGRRLLLVFGFVLTGAFALAACGGNDNGGAVADVPTTSGQPVDIALVVEVTNTTSGARSGSITCRRTVASGTGTFLDAAAANGICAAILNDPQAEHRLVSGPTTGAQCTEQDGGPATARVTGSFLDSSVDATFSRHNSCEVSDWDHFSALLGMP